MRLLMSIALRHLLARRRQSLVSLSGIVIGVAFFLAISSLMQGSQNDFIKRMIDNSPHITIYDEYRNVSKQPLEILYPKGVIEIRNVKPLSEIRGIRGFKQILQELRQKPGVRAAAVLSGQGLLNYAGQEINH
jgi:lipoprotein-releasing system permease protein